MSVQRARAARCAPAWSGTPSGSVLEAPRCVRPVQHARIVDIGGGTGGFAVRARRAGPPGPGRRPQPRRPGRPRPAGRRARRHRPGHRRPGRPGRPGSTWSRTSADVVLCHGVLEVVDDPAAALATIARVLRPGGTLSLLVAQRHAAVIARAMAGHFQQARAPARPRPGRTRRSRPGRPPVHPDELAALLVDAGLDVRRGPRRPGLRRPGARLPARPRARRHPGPGRAGAGRGRAPEYLPLATQLHVLAHAAEPAGPGPR